MSSQDPSTSPKLTSSSSPATQPATDAAAAASQPPQDSTMLSSRGANGEGQYRELEDDHGHERQTHEMTDMGNSHQQQHAAAGADSDNTTTAGSMTATTMQKEALHPRKDLPNWKWQGTLAVCVLTSLVNGRLDFVFSQSIRGQLPWSRCIWRLKCWACSWCGLPSLDCL